MTVRSINLHVKNDGMPRVARGEYDMVAVVHWYIAYLKAEITRARRGDESEQQARARLVKATANLREIELAKESGLLIEADSIRELLEKIVTSFKTKMLAIPTKLPQRLVVCKGIPAMKEILEAEIYEALNELSNTNVTGEAKKARSVGASNRPTSGKATRKRLG